MHVYMYKAKSSNSWVQDKSACTVMKTRSFASDKDDMTDHLTVRLGEA
jgi:hypothetical protein